MNNFINDFFLKSSNILSNNLTEYISNNNSIQNVDLEVVCKSLELISTMCQILPNAIQSKFEDSNIFDLIFQLVKLHDLNVRSYVFNLIGEFYHFPKTSFLYSNIKKVLYLMSFCLTDPEYIPDLLKDGEKNELDYVYSYNKCCCAFGSLSTLFGEEMIETLDKVMNVLVELLTKENVSYRIKYS